VRQTAIVVTRCLKKRIVFGSVSLAFRGLTPGWLYCFGRLELTVSSEMFWLIVIIVIALNLLLKSLWGFSDFSVLLNYGPCYPVYLVRMAFLFL
jgi:hypothetical protein